MPIYTYECERCGTRYEEIHPYGTDWIPCTVQDHNDEQCAGIARRIVSLPAPAQFNCSMPTYQKPKT